MRYLVDTDWVIDYLKGQQPTVDVLQSLSQDGLGISVITYGEIYEGVYYGKNPQAHEQGFLSFLQGVDVIPLRKNMLRQFAQIRGTLRMQGQLIGDLDILIAATAIAYDLTLLTRNFKHFQRVPDLVLYPQSA